MRELLLKTYPDTNWKKGRMEYWVVRTVAMTSPTIGDIITKEVVDAYINGGIKVTIGGALVEDHDHSGQ